MIKQKVRSVNVSLGRVDKANGIQEVEFELLNKHLEEGYVVADRFSTVSNSNSLYVVNITFILQKEE